MQKKNLFRILNVALLLMLPLTIQAQQHDSNAQKAAKALSLNLDSILRDTLPGTKEISYKGQKLILRIGKNHSLEHIGMPLFNAYIRTLQPSPIYDYLEYAALDHKYHISENDLLLQQLKFQKGDWKTLESLSDDMMCSINNIDDKQYVVTWSDNGKEIVIVNFPINYELLANSNRKEILEKFVADLKVFKSDKRITLNFDTIHMEPYNKQGIYIHKGDYYTIPAINSNTYYKKTSGKGKNHFVLLKDKQFAGETLANRILSPGSFEGSPVMNIVCYLYNHRKETIKTTLDTWMAFCQQNGCKPYYGFESNHDGQLTSTLIMRNRESGYDHILTIRCRQEQLEDEDIQLDVTAYLFAPSANVSNLFHKPDRTSQKRKYILQ